MNREVSINIIIEIWEICKYCKQNFFRVRSCIYISIVEKSRIEIYSFEFKFNSRQFFLSQFDRITSYIFDEMLSKVILSKRNCFSNINEKIPSPSAKVPTVHESVDLMFLKN